MLHTALVLLTSWVIVSDQEKTISEAQFQNYIKFHEFHFELRFTPEERNSYLELLKKDVEAGRLKDEIAQRETLLQKLTSGDWLTIYGWHREQQDVDHIEFSTEQTINNGNIYGGGVYANIRKQAKDGHQSSKFFLSVKAAYDKPLRGDGGIYSSLMRKHVDASYEWNAVRLVFVTKRKVWDGSEANRNEIQRQFLEVWDKASTNEENRSWVLGWHKNNVMDWTVWRAGDYGYVKRMTPYQMRVQIAEWGKEIVTFMPAIKKDVEARIQELKEYTAKMPDAEVKSEFERLEKANSRFRTYMMQKAQQAEDMKATFAAMRKTMQAFHVVNLNISENTGNSGYKWTLGG